MHYHLDPLGGIAGDMFAAAMTDLHPDLRAGLTAAFEAAGLAAYVSISFQQHRDPVFTGHRFQVDEVPRKSAPAHHPWREIRALLQGSALAQAVLTHALAIFEHLAEAEAQVHGLSAEEVTFHEVGAWDSIADVVAAAWLIDAVQSATWSCAPLPLGSGRVSTAHGQLPVPAPATAVLLQGYPVFQDGIPGERITPTGAAILRHLEPRFSPARQTRSLAGSGIGFGTRTLDGASNILRVLAFEDPATTRAHEQLVVCQFEVDDQTPEDLAIGLDALRGAPGVLDVVQSSVVGKKGRLGVQVQVLAETQALEETIVRCLTETSTLGVRWHAAGRVAVPRETGDALVDGRRVRVKKALRPDGVTTAKAEMDDLAGEPGGHAAREQARRQAEDGRTTEMRPQQDSEVDEGAP